MTLQVTITCFKFWIFFLFYHIYYLALSRLYHSFHLIPSFLLFISVSFIGVFIQVWNNWFLLVISFMVIRCFFSFWLFFFFIFFRCKFIYTKYYRFCYFLRLILSKGSLFLSVWSKGNKKVRAFAPLMLRKSLQRHLFSLDRDSFTTTPDLLLKPYNDHLLLFWWFQY